MEVASAERNLHLCVCTCVTVCEHLVGRDRVSISVPWALPRKEGRDPESHQPGGDPCVSSEGREKRKNENPEVSARVAGKRKEGHGRCPRLPLDCRLVNKLV